MLSNEEVRKTCGDMGTQAILEGNKDPPLPHGRHSDLEFSSCPSPMLCVVFPLSAITAMFDVEYYRPSCCSFKSFSSRTGSSRADWLILEVS